MGGMSTMTAAQVAQQANRTSDGRYAEKEGFDPGELSLGVNRFLPSVFDPDRAGAEFRLAVDSGDALFDLDPGEKKALLARLARRQPSVA